MEDASMDHINCDIHGGKRVYYYINFEQRSETISVR
jgi:hypothetical protein